MHHAQSFFGSLGTGGVFLDRSLSSAEATQAQRLLRVDATNYLYSACVSIGDSIQAIDRSLFTWATVKLYYANFYLLRCLLALSGFALAYDGSKPRMITCKAGEVPIPLNGVKGTHKAVVAYYTRMFPSSPLLSQSIGTDKPFDWLMLRREEANYGSARFGDPQCPVHFSIIARNGVRRTLTSYVEDTTYLYAFDPDHAILALPIEALKIALAHPELDISANTDLDAQRFFKDIFSDKAGSMPTMLHLLRV